MQSINNIVLIGPKKPPITGQSEAFEILLKGLDDGKQKILLINLSPSNDKDYGSGFRYRRILDVIVVLTKVLLIEIKHRNNLFYITVAQSTLGFIKDMLIIKMLSLFRKNITAHIHGGNFNQFYNTQNSVTKYLIRHTYRRVENIIVLSEKFIEMFDFDSAILSKVKVVKNCCNLDFSLGLKKKINNNHIEITYLSNLIESKGFMDLLELAKMLKENNRSFTINIAGDFVINKEEPSQISSIQELKNAFYSKIEKYNIKKHINYLGVVNPQNKDLLLKKTDFLVLPTKYNNEGQPISLIEGLAYGCVLLSTNYRAIPDMLIENETGLYIKNGEPSTIFSAIEKIINDNSFEKMSLNSSSLYNNEFKKNMYIESIKNIIISSKGS